MVFAKIGAKVQLFAIHAAHFLKKTRPRTRKFGNTNFFALPSFQKWRFHREIRVFFCGFGTGQNFGQTAQKIFFNRLKFFAPPSKILFQAPERPAQSPKKSLRAGKNNPAP